MYKKKQCTEYIEECVVVCMFVCESITFKGFLRRIRFGVHKVLVCACVCVLVTHLNAICSFFFKKKKTFVAKNEKIQ